MSPIKKLWIGLGILMILSPVGLILPDRFKAGAAWGEWGTEEIQKMVGYIPRGLEKLAGLWSAPLPDYAIKGWEEKGLPGLSFSYFISALIGVSLIVAIMVILGKCLTRNHDERFEQK